MEKTKIMCQRAVFLREQSFLCSVPQKHASLIWLNSDFSVTSKCRWNHHKVDTLWVQNGPVSSVEAKKQRMLIPERVF